LKRPLLWLTVGFMFGIGSSVFYGLPISYSYGFSFLFVTLSLLTLSKSSRFLPFFIACLFAIFGNSIAVKQINEVHQQEILAWANGVKSYWAGEVIEACEKKGKGSELLVAIYAIRQNQDLSLSSGTLQVRVLQGDCSFERGDEIQGYSLIKIPQGFRNFSSWDFPFSLLIRGASTLTSVESPEHLVKRAENLKFNSHFAVFLKNKIEKSFSTLPESESKNILKALLLGQKTALDPKTQKLFQRTGTLHLLVVSGLHFAMLAGFFYFFFRAVFSLYPPLAYYISLPRLALFFSIFPVLIYALILPYSPSVFRSVLAILITVFFLGISRKSDGLGVLTFAAWVLLLLNPLSLFDPSFQFSFLAVAAIFWSAPRVSRWCDARVHPLFQNRTIRALLEFMGISIAIQLFLFPLSIYYFHQWSSVGLVANSFLVPYFSFLLMPIGFLGLLTFPYPFLSHFFLHLSLSLLKPVLAILSFLSHFEGSLIWVSGFRRVEFVFYFTFLYLCFFAFKRFSIFLRTGVFLSLIFILCFLRPSLQALDSDLGLRFYDVGQGDALLLSLPKGKNILVDAGGLAYSDFDLGEKVLVPALLGEGVSNIDTLILTHPHPDHYGGMSALLDVYSPGKIFWNGENLQDPRLQDLLEKIREKGIELRTLNASTPPWEESELHFRVLSPGPNVYFSKKPDSATINNHSLVMELTYEGFKILLAGDIQKETEALLVKTQQLNPVDLLKVPHHGSDTSSTRDFLQKLQPRIALMGVGKNNSFHFPREEVLERYQVLGTQVLRTDEDGEIEVKFKQRKIILYTFAGKKIILPQIQPQE